MDLDILNKITKVDTPENLFDRIQLMISNTSLSVASKSYKLAFSVAATLILIFNISIIYQYYQNKDNQQVQQPQLLSSDYSSVQNDIYND